MYFTKQDYEKIYAYILDKSKKDTDFESIQSVTGDELLSLIQEGVNKNITIDKLLQLVDEHGIEILVEQDEGDSATRVMSQQATTASFNDIRETVDNILEDVIGVEEGAAPIQTQINNINEHIGDPTSPEAGSIQSQINTINTTIGGEGPDSIQNQLTNLREYKLTRGSVSSTGDVVNNLTTDDDNLPLSASMGVALNNKIDSYIISPVSPEDLQIYVDNGVLVIDHNL